VLRGWPGELDVVLFGPLVDDVGELAGAVVGFVCGDLVQVVTASSRRSCVASQPVAQSCQVSSAPGIASTDCDDCPSVSMSTSLEFCAEG